MSNQSGYDYSLKGDIAGQQLTIMSELFKAVNSMQHIDELLQWFASRIVQHFSMQVTEVWCMQAMSTGQFSMQLRTLVCQDASLPEYVVTNPQVAGLADLLMQQHNSFHLQPAANLFPSYQASLLSRYGLNYCAGHFFSNTSLLMPPASRGASPGSIPSPLVIAMLFFLRQSPPQQAIATIGLLLEQTIAVAIRHGLLTSVRASPASGNLPAQFPASSRQQSAPFALTELIPHRRTDAALMMSSNPLSRSVDIADKQARRLYTAINGHRNIGELSATTGLNLKEISQALQLLLRERRIELFTPDGQPVNSLP
jgi:hypothetical protein